MECGSVSYRLFVWIPRRQLRCRTPRTTSILRSVEGHVIPAKLVLRESAGGGIHRKGEAPPRPDDRHSRASGNPPEVDPRPRGGDDHFPWFGWTDGLISTPSKVTSFSRKREST
jgi:hypothetical protein